MSLLRAEAILADEVYIMSQGEQMSPKVAALTNALKSYDVVINRAKRTVNKDISTEQLKKNIRKKANFVKKTEAEKLAEGVKSEKGFLDWSGAGRPDKMGKNQYDLLKEDLKMDIAEYVKRYWDHRSKTDSKFSATDIANVLSAEFGLPKKTVADF